MLQRPVEKPIQNLLCKKSSEFWTARFDAVQIQPRRLWRSFDELLGRRGVPVTVIDATNLHRHFDDKVAGVRAATAGVEPPTFTSVPVGCVLRIFSPITPAEVEALVQSLPDKHCMSHPLPTWLLKTRSSATAEKQRVSCPHGGRVGLDRPAPSPSVRSGHTYAYG